MNLIFEKNGITKYLSASPYGAHYGITEQIFINNPAFGVGVKNFRIESYKKENLNNIDNVFVESGWGGNTHPHQVHYEFLAETGLFGYISFLIFILLSIYFSIKNFLVHKDIFQLCGILFVISSLIPLIPSGSFLSTYNSSIFWLNYSLMVSYIRRY